MLNIRNGLFETNSSSTHSLTYTRDKYIEWVNKVFGELQNEFPDARIRFNIAYEPDGYGDGELIAEFRMPVEE